MTEELIYTSAEKGIDPQSTGFCTVKMTSKMHPELRRYLEQLSNYDHESLVNGSSISPVNYIYKVINIGNAQWYILGRIRYAELDYTNRNNFLAHFIALDSNDVRSVAYCDPASLLSREQLFIEYYNGNPGYLSPRTIPATLSNPSLTNCHTWKSLTGDSGWAGRLLELLLDRSGEPVFLVYRHGTNPLDLIAEATSLLHYQMKWNINFVTYYTSIFKNIAGQQQQSAQLLCVQEGAKDTHKTIERWKHRAIFAWANGNQVLNNSDFVNKARQGIGLYSDNNPAANSTLSVTTSTLKRSPISQVSQPQNVKLMKKKMPTTINAPQHDNSDYSFSEADQNHLPLSPPPLNKRANASSFSLVNILTVVSVVTSGLFLTATVLCVVFLFKWKTWEKNYNELKEKVAVSDSKPGVPDQINENGTQTQDDNKTGKPDSGNGRNDNNKDEHKKPAEEEKKQEAPNPAPNSDTGTPQTKASELISNYHLFNEDGNNYSAQSNESFGELSFFCPESAESKSLVLGKKNSTNSGELKYFISLDDNNDKLIHAATINANNSGIVIKLASPEHNNVINKIVISTKEAEYFCLDNRKHVEKFELIERQTKDHNEYISVNNMNDITGGYLNKIDLNTLRILVGNTSGSNYKLIEIDIKNISFRLDNDKLSISIKGEIPSGDLILGVHTIPISIQDSFGNPEKKKMCPILPLFKMEKSIKNESPKPTPDSK